MDKHAWNLGGVLAKCNEMGGQAAQGVGYGMAYVFSKGMVQVRVVVGGRGGRGQRERGLSLIHISQGIVR